MITTILTFIGFLITILGAACADSENMMYPVCICFVGVALMFGGYISSKFLKGKR